MIRIWLLRLLGLLLRPFVYRPASPVPRHILYVKPDHLGDVLLATPALRLLRLRFPDAQITALVGPWAATLLASSQDIDQVQTCPFPGFTRSAKGSLWQPYLLLLRYGLLLRPLRYDVAIIGRDDHWWGALLALVAGIPCRIGFALPACRPLLSRALLHNPREHVAAQGIALVEAVPFPQPESPAQAIDLAYRYTPSPAARDWAGRWLNEVGIAPQQFVVIHPGTGGSSKLWLTERWAQVCDALQNQGLIVVLTGGPGEEALVTAVASQAKRPPTQLVAQTSVDQLAALLEQAQLVLGVDSGPLHVAAAVGVPTVHLFGPSDHGRFGPWADPRRHTILCTGLWCSPCGVFTACPRGIVPAPCMEAISTEAVLEAAKGGGLQTAPLVPIITRE